MGAPARHHVAIVEAAAPYRRGLEAALAAAGFNVDAPEDVSSWAARPKRVVVLAVHDPADLGRLEELAERGAAVVALVTEASVEPMAACLRAGALGVADWSDSPESIVTMIVEALAGRVVLPLDIAAQLAGSLPQRTAAPDLTQEEVTWLTALAAGTTVVKLADDVGYSERAMFRRLADLYVRLGAHNRTEALLAAERLGLLDLSPG